MIRLDFCPWDYYLVAGMFSIRKLHLELVAAHKWQVCICHTEVSEPPFVSCLSIRIDCKGGRGVIGDVQQKIIPSSRNRNQFSKIYFFLLKMQLFALGTSASFLVWANDLCMFFGCLLLQLKTHSLTPCFQGNQDTIHSWNVSSILKTNTHEHRLFVCLYKKIWLYHSLLARLLISMPSSNWRKNHLSVVSIFEGSQWMHLF